MAMKTLGVDLETFSPQPLGKSGVYRYAADPNFDVLLFAYSVDNGPVEVVSTGTGEPLPDDILAALFDPTVTKYAFNASFERVCLTYWLRAQELLDPDRWLDAAQWRCSMVWATALGLPRSLKTVAEALKLDHQKMDEGKKLIEFFSVPVKVKDSGAQMDLLNLGESMQRNMPKDDPDKWALFVDYCAMDVEVENELRNKLSAVPLPDSVWREYAVDQRINDRGIQLDLDLADAAVKIDADYRDHCMDEARELTGLDNPASPTQMLDWLHEQGVMVASMSKEHIEDALESATGVTRRVLELRQDLSRSSVAKYQSMQKCVAPDGRAHGLLQFHGAGRTGRWAGRLIQVQNLPRNYLKDLDVARTIAHQGDADTMEMLFDSVPDTLSQLIRTAFVPRAGTRFIVADYSAIEARVLAWLAGQASTLKAFIEGKDLYCETASSMFGVPVEKHGRNADLRQKGKIAVLACIAEGQRVLTDQGLIPIENVTSSHRVWDGYEWVHHEGLIDRGVKHVITYDGLTATPDHLVWVDGEHRPILFGDAAASGARLAQTGHGGNPIRLGHDHQLGETLEQDLEHVLRADQVHQLPLHPVAVFGKPHAGKVEGVPSVLPTADDSEVAGSSAHGGEATLHQSEGSALSPLWRSGDHVRLSDGDRSWAVGGGESRSPSRHGIGSDRQRRPVCAGQSAVGDSIATESQSTAIGDAPVGSERVAVCEKRCDSDAAFRQIARTDSGFSSRGGAYEAEELEGDRTTTRVYDLLNAGPRHRFTVENTLVHNCGYQGGVGAMKAMGAERMGIPEAELQPIVDAWRNANPQVVDYWYAIDSAAKNVIETGQPIDVGHVTLRLHAGALRIELPSGRALSYPGATMGTNRFGSPSVVFKGIHINQKFQHEETYGGKLVENITQAVARDLLAFALGTLEAAGHKVVMHVHDEAVVEAPPETTVAEICSLMTEAPAWARGLPMEADGYDCTYYQKD